MNILIRKFKSRMQRKDTFCSSEEKSPFRKRICPRLLLGDPEVTANLYSKFAYPYWEGCVICSIYLR